MDELASSLAQIRTNRLQKLENVTPETAENLIVVSSSSIKARRPRKSKKSKRSESSTSIETVTQESLMDNLIIEGRTLENDPLKKQDAAVDTAPAVENDRVSETPEMLEDESLVERLAPEIPPDTPKLSNQIVRKPSFHLPYVRVSDVFKIDDVSTNYDSIPISNDDISTYESFGVSTGPANALTVNNGMTRVSEKPIEINVYPTLSRTSNSLTRVTLGPSVLHAKSPATSIDLVRPMNGSSKASRYTQSSTNSLSSRSVFSKSIKSCYQSHEFSNQKQLPFLKLTNSLQLYLKLHILTGSDIIHSWTPGSFLWQTDLLNTDHSPNESQRFLSGGSPGYILLTSHYVHLFKPKFEYFDASETHLDEQTEYADPSKYLEHVQALTWSNILRIDVGPARQYLILRYFTAKPGQRSLLKDVSSLVFLTYSKINSTQMIDFIKSEICERECIDDRQLINQDIQYSTMNLQMGVFLRKGPKDTEIYTYENIFPADFHHFLNDDEVDSSIGFEITKVDFECIQTYVFGAVIRYESPKSVDIIPSTLISTMDYIYLLQERLDIWPPLIIPTEFSPQTFINGRIQSALKLTHIPIKGFKADMVPQYDKIYGCGRIQDIISVERWRSWRIDESFGSAYSPIGLNQRLQNGLVGGSSTNRPMTATGFLWWVRIVFGETDLPTESIRMHPISSPKSIPTSQFGIRVSYWWDLTFGTPESAVEFMDGLRNACYTRVKIKDGYGPLFIVGDD